MYDWFSVSKSAAITSFGMLAIHKFSHLLELSWYLLMNSSVVPRGRKENSELAAAEKRG